MQKLTIFFSVENDMLKSLEKSLCFFIDPSRRGIRISLRQSLICFNKYAFGEHWTELHKVPG